MSPRLAIPVLIALLAVSSSARAEESAADLVERGIELRTHRKDEEALALFRRAYALAPSPRTRVQIGLAEQALGMWALAETDIEAGLAMKSDPWIAKNGPALEAALAVVRDRLGSIEARVDVDGAELFIDGVSAGRLPLQRAARVTVGTHRLEVKAPGFVPSARTVEVTAGAILRETFDLGRESSDPARTSSDPAARATGGESRVPDAPPPVSSTQRTLGWTLVGVGIAAGAFAGVSFVLHEGQIRAYNDDAACPGRAQAVQPGACADRIDAADRWLTIGIASAVGSGMLALGGLVVALTAPRDGSTRAAVACSVHGCGLRF